MSRAEKSLPRRAGAGLAGFGRGAWRALRMLVLAVLVLELCSGLVVTAMNALIYGKTREGSRIVYDSYTLYTAASGMRETVAGQSSADSKRNRTIWFFGGSTLRAEDASVENTLPSILSRELNAQGPYSVQCLNFGVNSFNSMQEVQQLQKALLEHQAWPDLIVFLDGANDASYCIHGRDKNAHEGYARIKGFLESYWSSPLGVLKPLMAAAYASFTLELYTRLVYALVPVGADSPLLGQIGQAVAARYDYVDRTAQGMGAGFLAFLQPVAWAEQGGAALPEPELNRRMGLLPVMRTSFSNVYGSLEATLSGRPYFVDLRQAFAGRGFAAYRSDGIHNTEQGREVLAQAMLPAIRSALARRPGAFLAR